MKENRQKFATEMDYQEFVKWAIQHVLEEFLDSGLKGMRRGIEMVVHQSSMNEVFGGKKKS